MNLGRTVVRLLRLYFWILVGASILTVVWLLDAFVLEADVVATGWFAVVGFGVLVLLFLVVIRRTVQ